MIQISPRANLATIAQYAQIMADPNDVVYKPHTTDEVIRFISQTKEHLLQILGLSSTHQVIFLASAAREFYVDCCHQFKRKKRGYLNTGYWSQQAYNYARDICDASLISLDQVDRFDMLHFCECETIAGKTYEHLYGQLKTDALIAVDATGSLLASDVDRSRADVLFASSGKHFSLPGMTICCLSKHAMSQLADTRFTLARYCDGRFPVTPPLLQIRLLALHLSEHFNNGSRQHFVTLKKIAALLYSYIDSSANFTALVSQQMRSDVTLVFKCQSQSMHQKMIALYPGLKNHSSCPNTLRISVTNFDSVENAQLFIDQIEHTLGACEC